MHSVWMHGVGFFSKAARALALGVGGGVGGGILSIWCVWRLERCWSFGFYVIRLAKTLFSNEQEWTGLIVSFV